MRNLGRAVAAVAVLLLAAEARPAGAAITQQAPWTLEYTGTTAYPNGTVDAAYAVAAGTGRVLVVAVSATRTAAGAITCSATYGGTGMTPAAGDGTVTTTWNHTFLFYMPDTPTLMNGTARALSVTCSGGTAYATWAYSAVYAGVDQTTPLTSARNYNSNATGTNAVGPFNPGLSIGANDQAIEIVNLARSTSGTGAITIGTWAPGWTTAGLTNSRTTTGPTATAYVRDRNLLTAATDGSQHTASSTTAWDSMTAMAMKVAPPAVTIGNGSAEPASSSVTAGQVGALDTFSLAAASGTATVTSVGVTLAMTGTPLGNLFVSSSSTCTGGTTYGTLASPVNGANTVNLTTSYAATTATGATDLYLCATAGTVAASTTVTGSLSSASAAGYTFTDSDTSTAVLTVTPPPAVAIGNGSAEPVSSTVMVGQVGALDTFGLSASGGTATVTALGVALTMSGTPLTSLFVSSSSTCAGGTTYGTLASPVNGANTVNLTTAYTASAGSGSTDLYLCATAGNVAASTTVTGNVSSATAAGFVFTDADTSTAVLTVTPPPAIRLEVGDGTNPASVPQLCPSGAATMLDAFTLQAVGAADVVTRVTVQLAPSGAWANVAGVQITDATGATVYGSAIPGGDLVNVYVGSLAISTGAATGFMVRITPQTHAAMPAPNVGQQYATTGTVVSVASNSVRTYGDAGSATVTIDNLAPPEVTWAQAGVTTGAGSIQLNWTASTDVLVLRRPGGPVTDAPADGTTYSVNATIGGSTVACVGLSSSCNSTGLTAGAPYFFEVFTRDACGNYSLGAPAGPLYTAGAVEGSTVANTTVPVVGIINPMNQATVTGASPGFKVQVRAFSRMNGATAQPLTVRAKAASGASTFTTNCGSATDYPIALTVSTSYPSSSVNAIHGVYEANVVLAKGVYTLRACASNASGNVLSGSVGVSVNDGLTGSPRGDGNLLRRDNSGQLCSDCHALPTHTSEVVGNAYGSWYTACRDCHTPHSTRNVELVRERITPPAYRNQMGPRQVFFASRSTGFSATGGANSITTSAFTNVDGTGICQVCHTATLHYRNDGTLAGDHNPNQACTNCHPHSMGMGGGESKGGVVCSGCHSSIATMMTTPANSKHSLVGWTDTPTDSGVDWSAATTLGSIAPASRSCVNMCHSDHPHTLTSPVTATHEYNLLAAPNTLTTRAAGTSTSATRAATDFDPVAGTGMCTKCHARPISTGGPVITDAVYGASAHDFTSTTTPAITWSYGLHSGGTFARNCTKCHASPTEGNTPAVPAATSGLTAVHGGANPDLLAGTVNPGAAPSGFICYNCHGNGTVGTDRSGKDIATEIAGFYHPVSSGTTHDSAAESAATFNSGRFSGANRHVNCIDCHGPHAAGSTKVNRTATATATRNQLPAGSPLLGATGITYGPTYPVLVTTACAASIDLPNTCVMQTTSANYGTSPGPATLEYQVCFKCHTAYAFGTTFPTAPATGASGVLQTDLGSEFSPTNRSGHPVVVGLNSYTNSPAPKALVAAQLLAPWNVNVGTQTMLCTDCHNTDAASPAVQGPHGSAVRFMLAGANKAWPFTVAGATTGTAFDVSTSETGLGTTNGLFCRNCHPQQTSTGSNWIHQQYNAKTAHTGYFNCVNCHLRVPHGGKVSRLILTTNAPIRYKTTGATPSLAGFTKATNKGSYTNSNFKSGPCTEHNSTTSESW